MDNTLIFEMMKVLLREGEVEKIKPMMESLLNTLLEIEREQFIGVDRYHRSNRRNGVRNGYKPRKLKTTRFGSLELLLPQVRNGTETFHTELFDRYQRSEKALFLTVAEMYYKGVSTRKIADLYGQIFETDISPQFVSTAAAKLDAKIKAWREERFDKGFPILIVDAIYKKVRENHRIVSKSVLIVTGIDSDGRRRILDYTSANSENESDYKELFSRLQERGVRDVQLVISDAHQGLRSAITQMFQGASWQRCRLHFVRNYAKKLRNKKERKEFHALMKKIYEADKLEDSRKCARDVISFLSKSNHPRLAEKCEEEIEDTLQYYGRVADPDEENNRWKVKEVSIARKKLSTSNSIERINGELKRRIDSIRIFPSIESLERMIGALLMEQDEEWRFGRHYITFEED